MKKINFRGKYSDKKVLIDDKDYGFVNQILWQLDKDGYAISNISKKRVLMHRYILEVPKGKFIDHINGNRLDNRRDNLRIVTRAENNRNMRKHKDGKSLYKGVTWDKQADQWRVQICINYKQNFIGLFKSDLHAAMAYDLNAKEIYGSFAKLNFPL